ncbi:transcriptional regulator [Floricoccus penangensis]|uniref:Transcriptional regulator n=1 Tax=Floricoccus penangensis TaxID=1859475 RepID=A0A9Q5JG58_9LACT|nr:helix-turn-helix transcriptional regulator [Floricoccus penangensis]OFI46721.1 transcriptional regulator [Floricoccus penangensis]
MDILLERIKELCKKRGITISALEDKLGIPSNTIYQWKKRVPKTERLQLVADYFGVSTDYLLGRDENTAPTEEDLERMTDNAMSFGGKPLSDNDRKVVKDFLKAYFANK